jgi:hypothetical protein
MGRHANGCRPEGSAGFETSARLFHRVMQRSIAQPVQSVIVNDPGSRAESHTRRPGMLAGVWVSQPFERIPSRSRHPTLQVE